MKTFRLSLIALSLFPLPGIGDDLGAEVQTSAAPKTPAIKTITNFTQSLRCMDELFYAYGKQGIAITSAGIPDETGKVKTGTKEMLITAVSKMLINLCYLMNGSCFPKLGTGLGAVLTLELKVVATC